LVDGAARAERGERSLDRAALRERALGVPASRPDPELVEILADVVEHARQARIEHDRKALAERALDRRDQPVEALLVACRFRRERLAHGVRIAEQAVAVLAREGGRYIAHVTALIAVARERQLVACERGIAEPDADGEDVH